jgi:hypothetical protein
MFRFFRTIRKRLLGDRNIGRYLLYAVGEILLVVIGILIALQVDNWNQERVERKEAVVFYQNMKQQLLEDHNNIEGQIAYNNKFKEQFTYAIQVIEADDRTQKDSLMRITGRLVDYSDFDREGKIYESIVNSGDIKLLKNDKIKKGLRGLEETYLYANRMETIHYDAIMQMIPDISRTINIAIRKIENEDALYSSQFSNSFALSLRIMDEKDLVYDRALNEIDFIVDLIEGELKDEKI